MIATRKPEFVARRRFDSADGERWTRYVAWSGLIQLREVVSLDTILCPAVPDSLVPEDWEHNVQADYRLDHFRSLPYLLRRVAGEGRLNVLAVLQEPSEEEIMRHALDGFAFAGLDVIDVHGDVSALTNCGGFDLVFAGSELNELGLLSNVARADAVRRGLRASYPGEPHAECDVWAIWRRNPTAEG